MMESRVQDVDVTRSCVQQNDIMLGDVCFWQSPVGTEHGAQNNRLFKAVERASES